jgi:SAM-dependent methyltransferase
MLCESFSAPNAKPVLNGGSALSWHKTVHDRNAHWSEELLVNLSKVGVLPPHIIEIGCGIGTFLKIAKEHGIDGTGYDSDFEAVSYGRTQFGLDLRSELWTFDKAHIVDNSLFVSISMLEHIHFPRQLIKDMVAYMKLTSGKIFISVPFANPPQWSYFLKGSIPGGAPANVHVTHFSEKGFRMVFKEFGATNFTKIISGGWIGYLVS